MCEARHEVQTKLNYWETISQTAERRSGTSSQDAVLGASAGNGFGDT